MKSENSLIGVIKAIFPSSKDKDWVIGAKVVILIFFTILFFTSISFFSDLQESIDNNPQESLTSQENNIPDQPDPAEQFDLEELGTHKLHTVTEVVDGDTFKIDFNGSPETVRLVAVDTPETVNPSTEVQCYGKEASDYMKDLLSENAQIYLDYDSKQGERDGFDRLLGYVWKYLENGQPDIFINKQLLLEGYATVYDTVQSDRLREFRGYETQAKSAEKGLWGNACKCVKGKEISRECSACSEATVTKTQWNCDEYTEKIEDSSCDAQCPVPEVEGATIQPTVPVQQPSPPVTTQQPPVTTPPPSSPQCLYSCTGPDRDCADFSSHAQAQNFFNCCKFTPSYDPMRLDADNDGLACENN